MIKFGFIGCGQIAKFHADVIAALRHNITCVSATEGSKNIENFAMRYAVTGLYSDWKKMIKEQNPDALVVAVNWNQTENIIQEIINHGIPCLVEKPIALSSYTLQKIISNTAQFNDRVMVGYNRRFYDFIPMVKQPLKEKEIISVELNFPETLNRLIEELKSPEIADYILIYMSSHWLDLLMFVLGDLKVEWMTKKINKRSNHIEAYNGILRSLQYNIPIHLQANFNAPSNTSITFNFNDAIYRLCPIEILTVYRGMTLIEPSTENPVRRYIPHIEGTYTTDVAYKPGFLKQMSYFIETYVQKIRHDAPYCTLYSALAVTRLCEEIKSFAEIT